METRKRPPAADQNRRSTIREGQVRWAESKASISTKDNTPFKERPNKEAILTVIRSMSRASQRPTESLWFTRLEVALHV